ncbi:mannosyl-3-phosphoglycerate phosphatase [Tropicimonas sp. IMCC34043]|uniref:HAD-IIB family hydrolase n=1 Tax=Tropicimonas sp. IMCC34043 TaxID=2248760 RepID=UPI000E246C01|nr:HAD hydrolase family protein [Tropicimonas sp. IMCC34043]
MSQPPLIVFTDLDGTLLDHRSYSPEAARPALDRLARLGIPLILASSKTAAEIDLLRDEIGCRAFPAIVENGAGILEATPDADTGTYDRLRAALDEVPPALRAQFTGFGDMGAAGVARATGLPPAAARLAARRQFSEPGLWKGNAAMLASFRTSLAALGISARHGGRFLTLSFGGTKADRMAAIAARYGTPTSLALGDAPNDAEMIAAATHGVIVANPHGTPLPALPGEATGQIRRTAAPGPEGWNDAVTALLDEMNL